MAVGREAGRSRECRCRLLAPRPVAGAMTGADRPAAVWRRRTEAVEGRRHDRPRIRARRFSRRWPAQAAAAMAVSTLITYLSVLPP